MDDDLGTEEPEEPDHEPEPEKPARPFWVELPALLLTALVVAVLVKTFLVQPFYIPSESMLPTIEVNDRVMVNKLAYDFGKPRQGDIVVFLNPGLSEDQINESFPQAVVRSVLEAVGVRVRGEDDLIKRVVAVGGQTLEIRNGVLSVDGKALNETYLAQGSSMPDFGPITVPENEVFVMGDNRNASLDSRRFGPIPDDEIVGKAVVRIWPLGRIGGL
ncbi:MAG: signal peptidase I [Acidimicrobiia bacterium]